MQFEYGSIEEHIKAINAWLDEHVQKFAPKTSITLHSFEIDWEELRGSFSVRFDDQECSDRFSFSCTTITGWAEVYYPVFHSPLGAPASYGAVDISKEGDQALKQAIKELFPKLKPLGPDKESGQQIWPQSPAAMRVVNVDEWEPVKAKLREPGFQLVCPLKNAGD